MRCKVSKFIGQNGLLPFLGKLRTSVMSVYKYTLIQILMKNFHMANFGFRKPLDQIYLKQSHY